jgi:hypothetical protein
MMVDRKLIPKSLASKGRVTHTSVCRKERQDDSRQYGCDINNMQSSQFQTSRTKQDASRVSRSASKLKLKRNTPWQQRVRPKWKARAWDCSSHVHMRRSTTIMSEWGRYGWQMVLRPECHLLANQSMLR